MNDSRGFFTTIFGDMSRLITITAEATGEISHTEAAIQLFKSSTGEAADSAEAFLTIMTEFKISAEDLNKEIELTPDQINKIRDASDELLISFGLTDDQIQDLRDTLEKDVVRASQTARDRGIHPLKTELDDTTDSAHAVGDALKALTDPLFGVIDATNRVETASRKYNDAVAESGPKSQEAEDAAIDLAASRSQPRNPHPPLMRTRADQATDATHRHARTGRESRRRRSTGSNGPSKG